MFTYSIFLFPLSFYSPSPSLPRLVVAHSPLLLQENTPPTVPASNESMIPWTLAYVPAVRKKKPVMMMMMLRRMDSQSPIGFRTRPTSLSAERILKYATPQKMKPNQLSKRELMTESTNKDRRNWAF